MWWLVLGSLSFLIFLVYDFNQILLHKKYFAPFFALGCVLLGVSTIALAFEGKKELTQTTVIFWGVAFLFLFLLVYTLFFALPFQETYVQGGAHQAYTQGVYALCRHPGALWLSGFYLFYWLAAGGKWLFYSWLAFTALDVAYVCIQDKVIFPKLFENYEKYRRTTPFLVPSGASLQKCLRHYRDRHNTKM